jgi:hypothetical protein
MKLVVCGSSWSCVSKIVRFEGTHWSELLAKKCNASLINLAIGGATNANIRLQLDTAKKLKPDFIFFNADDAARIDVKNYNSNILEKNIKKYNTKNFTEQKSSTNNLISITTATIESSFKNKKISENQKQAIIDYFIHIYDDNWKNQVDQYIINSGIYELYDQKFNFLFNPYLLSDDFDLPKFIKEKHFVNEDLNFNKIRKLYHFIDGNDPGYHTTPEGQQVIAEKYYTAITNYIEKYNVNIGK